MRSLSEDVDLWLAPRLTTTPRASGSWAMASLVFGAPKSLSLAASRLMMPVAVWGRGGRSAAASSARSAYPQDLDSLSLRLVKGSYVTDILNNLYNMKL